MLAEQPFHVRHPRHEVPLNPLGIEGGETHQAVQGPELGHEGFLRRFFLMQFVEDRVRRSPAGDGLDQVAYPCLDEGQLPLDRQPLVGERRLSRPNFRQRSLHRLGDHSLVEDGVERMEQRRVERLLVYPQIVGADRWPAPVVEGTHVEVLPLAGVPLERNQRPAADAAFRQPAQEIGRTQIGAGRMAAELPVRGAGEGIAGLLDLGMHALPQLVGNDAQVGRVELEPL